MIEKPATYLQGYQHYLFVPETRPDLQTKYEQMWRFEAPIVWAKLVSEAGAIRTEPLYSDARAVAAAMMQRARHNVALLVERLPQLGYRFNPLGLEVWQQPNPELTQMLDQIEQTYGPVPLTVRMWFDIVGSVTLTGAHPKLCEHTELRRKDGWIHEAFGLDPKHRALYWPTSDPLVVWSTFFIAQDGELLDDPPSGYALDIAPDLTLKHEESSEQSALYFHIPNPTFDAVIIGDDQRWTGTFFIPYLQTCFDWGGFPGLRHDPAAAERAREELAFLKEGLLPLL
jgi:hypothetical protein